MVCQRSPLLYIFCIMLEDLGLTYNKNKITNMSVSNGQSYILLSKTILDIHIERI